MNTADIERSIFLQARPEQDAVETRRTQQANAEPDLGARGERIKHGYARKHRKAPEYLIWMQMKTRCHNPNDNSFYRYGGRGITVCESWRTSFESFIADMGRRPSKNHSLDRIDNNAGYSKDNCRWATQEEQSFNRRVTKLLTIGGVTKSVGQWGRIAGIRQQTIASRLRSGWPESDLLIPSNPHRQKRRKAKASV